MNITEQRAAALKAAKDIVAEAKSEDRGLSADEAKSLNSRVEQVRELDAKIAEIRESKGALNALSTLMDPAGMSQANAGLPKSLGEHFVKFGGARLSELKGVKGASVGVPEFKAATDTQLIGAGMSGVLTQVDQTIITAVRPRLVIADLLGSGTLAGNAISYFVEGAFEGAYTTVAEGGAKPQLHFVDPTTVTDVLKKIAGWIKLSDEMIEDLPFLVSEINGRLLYELARFEETQLLNGLGTGSQILGLRKRSGVQTEARGNTASGDTIADALFRAITKTTTGSGLDADGIVMNPLDYQTLRLSKDGNGQYYGGGYFAGQYGNGPILNQPPVWGLQTVVTPAIEVGKAFVGAFGQAATVYRKGGVRVESTNSDATDFRSNIVTIRAEERLALAVRQPTAFVEVTLTAAP